MNTTRPRRRLALFGLAAVPVLAFVLAACSPTAGDAGGQPNEKPATAASSEPLYEWQLAYAACMRGEGVDFPDPDVNNGGVISLPSAGDAGAAEAAQKCGEELGNPPAMSPGEQKKADEAFRKMAAEMAQCYRDNGFDVADAPAGEMPKVPDDAPEEVLDECGGFVQATRIEP